MNDEKRHKNREIRIYKSLIIAAGIIVVAILLAVAGAAGVDFLGFLFFSLITPAGVALVVILIISVCGLFRCSWSTRTRILLWWACLFMFVVILVGASRYSEYSGYSEIRKFVILLLILLLGSVVLLILPTIWLRNAVRRVRGKLEND